MGRKAKRSPSIQPVGGIALTNGSVDRALGSDGSKWSRASRKLPEWHSMHQCGTEGNDRSHHTIHVHGHLVSFGTHYCLFCIHMGRWWKVEGPSTQGMLPSIDPCLAHLVHCTVLSSPSMATHVSSQGSHRAMGGTAFSSRLVLPNRPVSFPPLRLKERSIGRNVHDPSFQKVGSSD